MRTDTAVLWLAECVKRVYLGRVIRAFLCFSRGLEKHSQAFCSPQQKHLHMSFTGSEKSLDKEDEKKRVTLCDRWQPLHLYFAVDPL